MRVLRLLYVLLVPVCALAVSGALAAPAAAEVAPSLAGEALLAGPDQAGVGGAGTFDTTVNCNPDGSGTITFYAEGIAVGPYPGTFTESGSVTFGPQNPNAGTPTAINATFTIVSGTTIINGTKSLGFLPEFNFVNQAACFDANGTYLAEIVSAVSYVATINTATGTFQDSGRGHIDAQDVHVAGPPPFDANAFLESFDFSNGVVLVQTEAQLTGGGWILGTAGGNVSFGFTAQSDKNGTKGNCTVIDHAAGVDISCLTVETVVQTATHGYFIGQADVNGTVQNYRIDVDDLGEPGTGDTFTIRTDTYTASGPLLGGNIQVHS